MSYKLDVYFKNNEFALKNKKFNPNYESTPKTKSMPMVDIGITIFLFFSFSTAVGKLILIPIAI